MIAKVVADFFNEGLYDMHVHLKHIPMLEWEGPIILRKYTAQDVMSETMVSFPKIAKVGMFSVPYLEVHEYLVDSKPFRSYPAYPSVTCSSAFPGGNLPRGQVAQSEAHTDVEDASRETETVPEEQWFQFLAT